MNEPMYGTNEYSSEPCIGCQRHEMHKRCPAHGTPFYCSGIPYSKGIEELCAIFDGKLTIEELFEICKTDWELYGPY